jgi:hypothetical protein
MTEKILAALSAINGQYNLPKDYLEKVAATAPKFESEDEISAWVDSQKPMLGLMQSYADSRVSQAQKKVEPAQGDDLAKQLGILKDELKNDFKEQLDAATKSLRDENAELRKQVDTFNASASETKFLELKKRVATELGLSDKALGLLESKLDSSMDEKKINEVLSEGKKDLISLGLNPIEGSHYQHTVKDTAKEFAKNFLDDFEKNNK